LLTAWYSRTERGGWWAVEYRAQRRRGADPYRDGGDSAALRLARGMMIAGLLAIVVGFSSAGGCATDRRRLACRRLATGGMMSWKLPSSRKVQG
jgi:hypothetical protein